MKIQMNVGLIKTKGANTYYYMWEPSVRWHCTQIPRNKKIKWDDVTVLKEWRDV